MRYRAFRQARQCERKIAALAKRFPYQDDIDEEQWIHTLIDLIRIEH